jgi:methylenetetrahydrofolate--tRNA-(uracil-5-)-methyltransferase
LSQDIARITGSEHLYFFDAIAPIVTRESIDDQIAYRASRYDWENPGIGDYLNCPLNKDEYDRFAEALVTADRISLKHFEIPLAEGVTAGAHKYFEGCLPVEILASRDARALAYGPMRPIGLIDPRAGKRAYAVVQLRQDNQAASLYNLVGFQTNLTFAEQKRVFRMIPGLKHAEFVRYGQMHRNTFIYSPAHLLPSLQFRTREDLFFAGQITGVEGYVGNIATGLLAGINAARYARGEAPLTLPVETMTGALCNYITRAGEADFQPMKANFGILPPLEGEAARLRGKRPRAGAFVKRSERALTAYLSEIESN